MKIRACGFTLLEVVIMVALIGTLLAIAIPNYLRSAERGRRASCCANLRQIDAAKEQYTMEHRLNRGDPVNYASLFPEYIRTPRVLSCPTGGDYVLGNVGEDPVCTVHGGPYMDAE